MGFSIVRHDINIDFIGIRWIAIAVSVAIILAGIVSLTVKGGPRYGIDFAGGMIVQVKFKESVSLPEIEKSLGGSELPGLVVQNFGAQGDNAYLLRTSLADAPSDQVRGKIEKAFEAGLPGKAFEVQRLEMVGPKVGADLRAKALEALFWASLFIAIYISGRFEQRWLAAGIMAAGLGVGIAGLTWLGVPRGMLIVASMVISLALCWKLKLNFALGAVVAIIHDVMITAGIFSLLNKEFDLTIVAALLTIVGYSLNDTIIVYDRIRENMHGMKAGQLSTTINGAINQTLSRTLLTSGTTLAAVTCLYLFGGAVIHDFALAMIIGIVAGTYSSIYVATPILVSLIPDEPLPEPAKPAKRSIKTADGAQV